jgi:glyoxylase-like metal-dependent hydrolase (beta-lactamase superfamily II)
MVKTQPGYYRMMIGDFEVTALNDGVVYSSASSSLPNATSKEISDGLSANCLTDRIGMSYNAFLINTGDKLVLIDTGTGGKGANFAVFRGCGHLIANLRAAGYLPEQVDEVYITHTHLDHVGGLTLGEQRTFPNATVRAATSEVDGFLNPDRMAAAPKAKKAGLQALADLFQPYIKAGRFSAFNEDRTLVPGIRALATHGHTPGHTSYVVESGGQTMIVLGDLVHVGAVQLLYPSAHFGSDADPVEAAAQRIRVLQMAADGSFWIAGAHLSFPGIGHLRGNRGHFAWIPAIYTKPLEDENPFTKSKG